MKLNVYHWIGVTSLLIIMVSCHSETSETRSAKQRSSNIRVEGYIVKPSTLDQSITVSGTLKPFEETVLMSDIAGRVVSINLPEGKKVKQGAVLIKLFDSD